MRNTATRKGAKRKSANNRKGVPALTDEQLKSGYLSVAIHVGACPFRPGHVQLHVDAQFTRTQAEALKRLRRWLDETGQRTANGHKVQSLADVVRWLAEQLAADIDPEFAHYKGDADDQAID